MLKRCHVAVTNYEQVRELETRSVPEVDLLVADEAHRIRNLTSQSTQRLRRLKRKRMWALTGTPIERDRTDFASLLSTVAPERFSASDNQYEESQLRSISRPFILRRMKDDVLAELPPVFEHTELIELTPAQSASYRRTLRKPAIGAGAILAAINTLRQICDIDKSTGESSKIDRIIEHVDQVRLIREKAIVFSFYLEPLYILKQRLEHHFPDTGIFLVEGAHAIKEREESIVAFKAWPGSAVLLASSRVASEGLTLTEANHVLFVNQWWNPSANDQARDRVVRIGQDKPVRVLRFVCVNTIEEALEAILKRKAVVIHELVDLLAQLKHPLIFADGLADAAHLEEVA